MKIISITLILFAFFINNSLALPNKIKIELNPKNYGSYMKKVLRATVDDGDYIKKKHKKWLDANIIYSKKKIKAKIRITGDWKDHINSFNSSLYVKLTDGNFDGITRFKLLLPITRNYEQQIYWNNLLNFIGYKTLRMDFIEVDLNNKKYIAIFEEVPNKEFLENNQVREGPILEFDERIHWQNDGAFQKVNEFVKNHQVDKYEDDFYNIFNSIKVVNKSYLKSFEAVKISSDAIYLMSLKNWTNFFNNFQFYKSISKKYADHGLSLNNRIFAYSPVHFELFEIYKEGNITLDGDNNFIELCDQNNIDLEKFNLFYEKYNFKFKSTARMKCVFEDFMTNYKNLKDEKNNRLLLTKKEKSQSFEYLIKKIIQAIDSKNFREKKLKKNDLIQKYSLMYKNQFYICNFNTIVEEIVYCKEISINDYKNIISGDDIPYKSKDLKLFTINLGNIDFNLNVNILKNYKKNFYVFKDGYTNLIKLNEFKKNKNLPEEITFEIRHPKSRLLLYGDLSDKITLNFVYYGEHANKNIIDQFKNGRFNSNGLTGCVTFVNTKFNSAKLKSSGMFCEDSINIINSEGEINNIEIKDSLFDGLDIDYSNISIKNINVKFAQNDCIDFSGGFYKLQNLSLNFCGDKGISIGEKSNLSVENAKIFNSNIGIASKDSSILNIQNARVENAKVCFSAYNKKQEFTGSELNINYSFCNNYLYKVDIDNLSEINLIN